jgi:alkylation response protein AidB-like acyl-CoA dehydrogenase
MNFDLTDDQIALRDGIRSLLEGRFPMERIREGFDRATFDELAEAGVFSLRSDGFSWADAAIVYEELGRACVPGPLVDSFGATVPTGVVEPIPGRTIWIEHLDAIERLLVFSPDGVDVVDPRAVSGDPAEWPLDPLTPVTPIDALPAGTREGDAAQAYRWWQEGALLTAAQQVGLAGALVDLSVAYAIDREQFGRPIGAFQAVKHMCAEMAVKAEVARAAVHAAACVLDDPETGDLWRALHGAKSVAGETAIACGRLATQVHGGMGFTWEVDVHLYLKRAWVLDTRFGSADAHADAIAAALPAPG